MLNKLQQKFANTEFLPVLLTGLTVLLFLFYVWQVNVGSTAGFAVRDIEREITVLERDNERLNVRIASLQSVESVSRRLKMLGLQPVKEITYLVTNSTVAINQ
jgi:hypothetical protein